MKQLGILSFLITLLAACTGSSDFKEIRDFKNYEWPILKKESFEFTIADTSKTYQINYLIRTSVSYPFYNLYLNQTLSDFTGKTIVSSMDEIILFDEKTGKPFGDGLGDIYDNRVQAPKLSNYKFKKPGKYKWAISHNMRPDPLTGILSIGAEVIKSK
jgi:gliding motility-associated lipoprotein GldH